tara:strand:+ start:160 stop:1230 length:1071 start_codon:yes stop_codon:yes gene_type:complete
MSEEITPAVEEAGETNPTEQSNISASDFVNRRLGNQEEVAQEAPSSEETPVVEEASENVEANVEQSNTEESTQEPVSEDALSQFNLEEMSDEELREISEKLGSRAVARFGELTARRKQAEERMQAMEAQMRQMQEKQAKEVPVVKNNPLAKVNDPKQLQAKAKSAREVIDWAEDLLFEKGDYGVDDVIAEVKGKELTKADVRKSLKHSKDMLNKFIPAQMHKIKKVNESKVVRKQLIDKARKELPWVGDKESELHKKYVAMYNDPRLKPLLKNADLSAQMPYILAHATQSIYGRKPIVEGSKSPTLTPPKGGPTASRSEKTETVSAKALKNLDQRYKSNGNISDFIALRTKQLNNR